MTVRRKIASFVLLLGVLFLGARFLGASDKLVPATIVYLVPDGATRLEAEVRHPGSDAALARFVAVIEPTRHELQQKTRLPPGTHDVTITLTSPGGDARSIRTIEIVRDATVTIDLAGAIP